VDVKDELVVVSREEEVLAASARAREAAPFERREGRVERLQGRDVRWPGALDREGTDRLVEGAAERFNFGEFRQLRSRAWTRSA
jgi:hypothetical protein